jgi:PAS domain S-box-containing protein
MQSGSSLISPPLPDPVLTALKDSRSTWLAYALAPAGTALALGLRMTLDDDHGAILMIMLLPVLVTSVLGGTGPGIFCTILTTLASGYFLMEPLQSSLPDAVGGLELSILAASGALVSLLSGSLRHAQRQTEAVNARLLDRILMLNQTYDGILIWEWNGPITFWNRNARDLYGFSEEEAIGKISHLLLQTDCPEGLPNLLAHLQTHGTWEGTLHHTAGNGRRLVVDSRMVLVADAGRSFVVETNRDITESTLAEQRLARVHQRFETAFRLSPLGEVILRLSDQSIVEANESYSKMIGLTAQEIIAEPVPQKSRLLDEETRANLLHSLQQGQPVSGIDVRFHRANGSVGAGVLYAELIQGAPDPHALVVLHDVTARQRAEDHLRLANLDLQQFAYAAAHDLQEPTRNIANALGLFDRSHRSNLPPADLLLIQESIDSAKRMNRMIRDMLAFAKADTSFAVEAPRADAQIVLGEVLEILKIPIQESGAEVLSMPLPILGIEHTHLTQLFQNLLGNAIKYRAPAAIPRISIAARLDGAVWTLSFADNGIGFDPAFSQQIFGVFKRLHQSAEYPGTGIGLAICERITRLYGGRIWAQGSPGLGATFYMTLPALQRNARAASAAE